MINPQRFIDALVSRLDGMEASHSPVGTVYVSEQGIRPAGSLPSTQLPLAIVWGATFDEDDDGTGSEHTQRVTVQVAFVREAVETSVNRTRGMWQDMSFAANRLKNFESLSNDWGDMRFTDGEVGEVSGTRQVVGVYTVRAIGLNDNILT